MQKYSIGIIGYGDFTQLLIEQLSPYADIIVSSRSHNSGDAGNGARFAPLQEVLARPIIIPSIPSQFFDSFFARHAPLINPNALVVDVCSVKVKPLQSLLRHLPSTCQIIGTHPLLGPASVAKNGGLTGLRCVVSDIRTNGDVAARLISFLDELGLVVIERTPEEHDKEMAYVQGLSHYIGRSMDILNIPDSELSTFAYDELVAMKNIQGTDSWDLFTSIMHENPYAGQVNDQFKAAMRTLDERLNGSM